MTSFLESEFLQFNPRTLQEVRKKCNLDKPGAMDQAIDMLHDWIQKQEHFTKKDFHRGYLERVLISTKGSVEKAKHRVDKICTMRTMIPNFFIKCHAANDFPRLHESYINLHMPKLTPDNNRIYIAKVTAKNITADKFLEAYQHSIVLSEYMKLHDYSHGCYVVGDFRDVNIMELISHMNLIDLRNIITLYIEGYGFGVKGIYVISSSKMIDTFINIGKQLVSDKIGKRVKVLQDIEALHDNLPKHLLPEDYGGSQKSLLALHDEWMNVLSSEKHIAYTKEMNRARTNEALRRKDKIKEDYLGMPGTFKILNID